MKRELSILIPIYYGNATTLAESLLRQAEELSSEGLSYEIVVADDGTGDEDFVAANRRIGTWPHCRFIERKENVGRAAIRNFLASTAQYQWLLFLDGDMMVVRDDFLRRYLETAADELVVDGGVDVLPEHQQNFRHNLRCLYECQALKQHSTENRQQNPYRDFHTANFMVSRKVMLAHPFDERFRRYGYEDVLFGKQLRQSHVAISHIDNPIHFQNFESNASFVAKTEEGLRTLHEFRDELRGYSRLLTIADGIHLPMVRGLIVFWHAVVGRLERRWLCGPSPNLKVFSIYKLGHFLSLQRQAKQNLNEEK